MICKRKPPTILLEFGDHLPNLSNIYNELGFDNGLHGFRQNTFYILTANFPLPHISLDLDIEFLAPLILDAGNIKTDKFYPIISHFKKLGKGKRSKLNELQQKILNAFQIERFNSKPG